MNMLKASSSSTTATTTNKSSNVIACVCRAHCTHIQWNHNFCVRAMKGKRMHWKKERIQTDGKREENNNFVRIVKRSFSLCSRFLSSYCQCAVLCSGALCFSASTHFLTRLQVLFHIKNLLILCVFVCVCFFKR